MESLGLLCPKLATKEIERFAVCSIYNSISFAASLFPSKSGRVACLLWVMNSRALRHTYLSMEMLSRAISSLARMRE